ncbi:MAG TPA: AAA family ATPase [Candidatus Saccharimonadia bacterium]
MPPLLHPQTRARLDAIEPASRSFIFHGPRNIGKATAALELARRLNCQGDDTGLCAACRRFQAGAYPDLIMLAPEDKPSITIEQVRGVIHSLSMSTYVESGMRVIIADDATALTREAQNALLKLIEEPPARTMFILVTENPESLLVTIRSRCAAVYFAPVPAADIESWLVQHHGVPGPQAKDLAAASGGAPGAAINLATQPDVASSELQLAAWATDTPSLSLFKRLILAKRLIDDKADISRFGRLVHASLVAQLHQGQSLPAIADQLQALEQFRLQLQAKVAPRVALEKLMLEL